MHIHEILGWHWGMWIFFIIFCLLIIFGIAAIIRWFNTTTSDKESSIEILEKRYAKGEISKEDFEKMKKEITERRNQT
ncbi:MAG: electron transporter RnfE [Ectothiorhodospiraceae bacterium]|nr:electron transporter RnfE [Ectothiorhodospiraceae bacterium]